jgi:integrase
VDKGTFVRPDKRSLAEYLRAWFAALDLAPNTLAEYRMEIEKRIVPWIGHHKTADVTPELLDAFYIRLTGEGGRTGEGLSPRSVRLVHTILSKAFSDGMRRGTLSQNPASRATAPKQRRREFKTWNAAELRAFLEASKGDRLYPLWFLVATTGMRRSELLGLRWHDLDLEAGRLSIQQRVVLVDAKPVVLFGTKRESSRRLLKLDRATVQVLASWRVAQIEERLAAGEKWDDTGLVFTQATGAGMHPERVSRRFCLLRERAGLPAIRFHDLRHTYATLALQAGVPVKVVSERLGHKTTGITENLYLHVTPQMAEDAANTVANLILGNTGSGPSVNNP